MIEDVSFGTWHKMTEVGCAPAHAAAVQLRRAEGLVRYPTGKSAMVYYFFAADARAALRKMMASELAKPGALGQGPLWFRYCDHPLAQQTLEKLYAEFIDRFGSAPILHEGMT